MELSTQGLVTDGVGKLSSSLHSPCRPVPGVSPSLSLSLLLFLPAAPVFSVSRPFFFLAAVSYLLAPLLCFSCWTRSSCVVVATGKQDDISRVVSRVMQ